jgi:hypothetical protein
MMLRKTERGVQATQTPQEAEVEVDPGVVMKYRLRESRRKAAAQDNNLTKVPLWTFFVFLQSFH